MLSNGVVAILMGSDSDLPVIQSTLDVLQQLGVSYEVNILPVADVALGKTLD